RFTKSASGMSLRQVLVVFQFTVSTTLVAATVIVLVQLEFMQSKKLGLDKDRVIGIVGNADVNKNVNTFSDRLRNISNIKGVSWTWRSPFQTVIGNGLIIGPPRSDKGEQVMVGGICADEHYLGTLGLELIAGRNFLPKNVAHKDSTVREFIVN